MNSNSIESKEDLISKEKIENTLGKRIDFSVGKEKTRLQMRNFFFKKKNNIQ
jgi:hypothetical protein